MWMLNGPTHLGPRGGCCQAAAELVLRVAVGGSGGGSIAVYNSTAGHAGQSAPQTRTAPQQNGPNHLGMALLGRCALVGTGGWASYRELVCGRWAGGGGGVLHLVIGLEGDNGPGHSLPSPAPFPPPRKRHAEEMVNHVYCAILPSL